MQEEAGSDTACSETHRQVQQRAVSTHAGGGRFRHSVEEACRMSRFRHSVQ